MELHPNTGRGLPPRGRALDVGGVASNKRMQQTRPGVEAVPAPLSIIHVGLAADPCCSTDVSKDGGDEHRPPPCRPGQPGERLVRSSQHFRKGRE